MHGSSRWTFEGAFATNGLQGWLSSGSSYRFEKTFCMCKVQVLITANADERDRQIHIRLPQSRRPGHTATCSNFNRQSPVRIIIALYNERLL